MRSQGSAEKSGVNKPYKALSESRDRKEAVALELKHLQKLQAGLVDKGQKAIELMFGIFGE